MVALEEACGTTKKEKEDTRDGKKYEEEEEMVEMSIHDILRGKGESFPGLIPLIHAYLDIIACDKHTRKLVDKYLSFVSMRASGKLMTTAQWIRRFVTTHEDYKEDRYCTCTFSRTGR